MIRLRSRRVNRIRIIAVLPAERSVKGPVQVIAVGETYDFEHEASGSHKVRSSSNDSRLPAAGQRNEPMLLEK